MSPAVTNGQSARNEEVGISLEQYIACIGIFNLKCIFKIKQIFFPLLLPLLSLLSAVLVNVFKIRKICVEDQKNLYRFVLFSIFSYSL